MRNKHPFIHRQLAQILIVLGITLQLAVVESRAEERAFKELNFAVTVPPTWEEVKNPPPIKNAVALYRSPDHQRMMVVMVEENPLYKGPINEAFVFGLEKSLELHGGGKAVSSRYFEIAGIKAYERVGVQDVKGKEISTFMRILLADGRSYAMQAMRYDGGKTTEDNEIRSFMDSFHFITQPKPGISLDNKSDAFKFGYYAGRGLVYFILVGGVVALISVIIVIARRNAGRSGS